MRILGFEQKWPKLRSGSELTTFTTFRFKRRDKRDWEVGEEVKVVYRPRSKERELLGIAMITAKERRQFGNVSVYTSYCMTPWEARLDGFISYAEMEDWFYKRYGDRIFNEPINKLTLKWMCKFTQF